MKFEEKVRSMSAKEIIMAIVEGLRNPKYKIDMLTFGRAKDGICYGCAATNAVSQIADVTFRVDDIYINDRCGAVNSDRRFLHGFEEAINHLRRGDVELYNSYAYVQDFAEIKIKENPGLDLPILGNDYTPEDLEAYVELAEYQDHA